MSLAAQGVDTVDVLYIGLELIARAIHCTGSNSEATIAAMPELLTNCLRDLEASALANRGPLN
jgi:hypothetical protein